MKRKDEGGEAEPPPSKRAPLGEGRVASPVAAGLPNLSGHWRLDKERSAPMDPYLKAMGLCQMAIEGHRAKEAATETYYTIDQTGQGITTRKLSWSGTSVHALTWDVPLPQTGTLLKTITATLREEDRAVVTTFEMSNSRVLVDRKRLEDGGRAIQVHLELHIPGEDVISMERWLVVSDVPDKVEEEAGSENLEGEAAAEEEDSVA